MKRRTYLALFLTLLLGGGVVVFHATTFSNGIARAEEFQSEEQLQFTLNPSVSITLSGDLTIESLSPNDAKDSNIITVSAASNTASGYSLTSTVGSTTNASNQLRKDGTSTANIFSNLTANKGTLSDFDFNYWGYSYSTDSGSTWVSGNTGSTTSGYNGYTYDTASSTVTHINSTTSGSASIQYKIGAKAAGTQVAGNYTNVINFIGIGKVITTNYTINYNANGGTGAPATQTGTTTTGAVTLSTTAPTKESNLFQGWCTVDNTSDPSQCSGDTIKAGDAVALNSGSATSVTKTVYAVWKSTVSMQYIQDYTLATCAAEASDNVTVKDKRDDNEYTVKYINNECWMTQNLRYLGDTGSAAKTMTIGNNNSNVSNKSITLYSLNSSNAGNFNPYSSRCDSTNGYNNACVYDSDSETTGVWYNYYAASGGTISGSSNSTAATNDICPSGWHLPSGPNTTSGTDYNKLVGNTTSGWQNPTAGLTAFGAVAGGNYNNGSLDFTGYGLWWSATAYNATNRYTLLYNSSNGQFYGDGYFGRYSGSFVRCVRSS